VNNFPKSGKVRILVKTGVNETKIKEFDESKQVWRVDVAARPLENEANIEIVKFFSRLTKKQVRILSGLTSKEKVLLIPE
jgi:uncharacterized protein (TIGR00251 family)